MTQCNLQTHVNTHHPTLQLQFKSHEAVTWYDPSLHVRHVSVENFLRIVLDRTCPVYVFIIVCIGLHVPVVGSVL